MRLMARSTLLLHSFSRRVVPDHSSDRLPIVIRRTRVSSCDTTTYKCKMKPQLSSSSDFLRRNEREREGQKLKLAASFVSGGIKRRLIRREDGRARDRSRREQGRRFGDDDRASERRAERWTPAAMRRRARDGADAWKGAVASLVTFPVHSSVCRLQWWFPSAKGSCFKIWPHVQDGAVNTKN